MILWPIGAITLALVAHATVAAGRFLSRRADALVRAYRNRREARLLAKMDDRMLADIGLTRSDLRDAFSEPVWRDPTAVLAMRAGERRANRRRTAFGLQPYIGAAPPLAPADGFRRPPADRPAHLTL